MQLTISDLIGVLRNLVIYYPDLKNRPKLNTFGIVDRKSDLNSDTLEMTFEDYEAGYVWCRDWVYSGATANRGPKVEYAALIVEHKVTHRDVGSTISKAELWLNVFDTKDCGNRLHEKRTREQVYYDNMQIMACIINELYQYKWHTVTYPGGGSDQQLLTIELAAQLVADGVYTSAVDTSIDLVPNILELGAMFKNPDLTNKAGAYAVTCKLLVELCESPTDCYTNYTQPDHVQKGITGYKHQTEY